MKRRQRFTKKVLEWWVETQGCEFVRVFRPGLCEFDADVEVYCRSGAMTMPPE